MALKKVVLAVPHGFCAGVERAVLTVEKALELYPSPVYVRRQIVHNQHVVDELAARGAVFVQELSEVPRGSTVVFAAHGVSPEVRAEAVERGLKTIDATCPMVAKVHHEAKLYAERGLQILLIGQRGHDEVVGTTGEAPDHITLIEGPEDVDALRVADATKLVWLTQTTLSVDDTAETVSSLRAKFADLIDPPTEDICYATQNRQSAIKLIARHCDLVIVVGSKNSSNSTRLAGVALEAGAKVAHRVENASEIDPSWLVGVESVGVSSGASAPDVLLQAVLGYLQGQGFGQAIEEVFTEEDMYFPLPAELLHDLAVAEVAGAAG
jgi:4-hydroxy-3-methylbut-2-enyl diphosphate reductase